MRSALHHRWAARGYSLVELMIAMAIGLVIVAAVLYVFASNRQSYRTTEGMSRIQENARISFELLARDIREAASVPCGNSIPVADTLNGASIAGTTWVSWNNAIAGYDDGATFPGAAFGTAAGSRATGLTVASTTYESDAIQVIRGTGVGQTVVSDAPGSATITLQGNTKLDSTTDFSTGDIAMVCDYNQAAIFQITNVAGLVLTHAATGTAPGNCSSRLGIGLTTTWCDSNANTPARSFGANSLLVHVAANGWYLGCNGRGAASGGADCTQDAGRSLYRTTLQSNGAGGVSMVSEEIIDGVRGLKIQYLTNTATNYVDASGVADWATVVSAKLQITLSTLDTGLSTTAASTINASRITRDLTYVVNLRNRVL